MKKILLMAIAALMLYIAPANAQAYKSSRYYNDRTGHLDYSQNHNDSFFGQRANYYGLRIGPSFSTVNSDDPNLDGGNSQTGLNIGAVVGFALIDQEPLYIETGLFYTEKGGKKMLKDGKKMTYDLNYLELPAVVKYAIEIDDDFSVQPFAGCYLACGTSGKIRNYEERKAESSFSKQYFQRFDGGLRFGCGVGYDMFYADLTYDVGLSNICHDEFDKSHNGCLTLNFGVNF